MAYTGHNDLKPLRMPINCGGEQRLPSGYRGVGVISGTTKVGAHPGTAAPCRVNLHSVDGTLLSYTRTGVSGAYSFIGLASGDYMLLIQDEATNVWRGKTEYVTIP